MAYDGWGYPLCSNRGGHGRGHSLTFLRKLSGDIIDAIKRNKGRKFEFRICIMRDGVNFWQTVIKDKLTWKHSDSYEVEPTCLYELEMSPQLRIKHWFKRIKNTFIVVFREDNPQGVVFKKPDRSAYTLKVVGESRALGQALKDEFKKVMDPKNLFIIIVLAIVIGVVYLIVTDQVVI